MSNPTIKKRVCDRCGKEFFATYREWLCKDCMNDLGWEYTPKTNADHIRSMTDEELARMLWKTGRNYRVLRCDPVVDFKEQTAALIEWLKQPYKEDT